MKLLLQGAKMNATAKVCSVLIMCNLTGAAFAADRAVPADAGTVHRDPVTMTFRYDARDLQTREGASRVYHRILLAARRNCTLHGSLHIELRSVDKRCMTELVEKAVATAGAEQLASVHRALEHVDILARL
jgi:UrcA family protein